MVKVDIISGFLGAGKTTLIKKLYNSLFKSEKIAIVENEFGEIGIDGAFLKETGVNIKEINSGCICCSLSGNFKQALNELLSTYSLDRIVIEPSGVGKLSEVVEAVKNANELLKVNILCTVVDGNKVRMYHKNFGEFYVDQINAANTIVLSKCEKLSEEEVSKICEYLKQFNPTATIITTPISELNSKVLLENLEDGANLMELLIAKLKEQYKGHHHEHHHEHHHHEHCDCEEHEHHHHEHCDCEEHEHHHHEHHHECDNPNCCCHHHHDADEVFESVAIKTNKKYSKDDILDILKKLDSKNYGEVIRAKGIVNSNGTWLQFDYVPGSYEVRESESDITGKICVIGSKLLSKEIEILFN